jgi:RNA polymerase sigma-70 factor, ECF subfamily
MRERSDEDLVRAVRRGEIEAFDQLYARYARRLFSYLLHLSDDRARAEDLLQEVFLTALKSDALQLSPGKFGGWLFTVARNRALSELRKELRRKEAPELEPRAAPATPEAEVEKKETLALLAEAIGALSEQHRDVLMLKEVAGLTYSQIAAVQNVPEGTAKSRLHHAIRSVRRFFAERTGGMHHDDDV